MITVILSGGIGNQMFQYAAGRALSMQLKTDLQVDPYLLIRKKTASTTRGFDLKIFDIKAQETSSLKNKLISKSLSYLKRYELEFFIYEKLNVLRDKRAEKYDASFEHLKNNTTLFGYFQNENYFSSIADIIRKDFDFMPPQDSQNLNMCTDIKRNNSVAVHIRRGDYLNSTGNLANLDLDYYKRAIHFIKERKQNLVFYFFSDDVEWVKQNISISDLSCKYIDFNTGENSFRDMQLMSLCKHNIIANSSFSWWSAWLNSNSEKIVIAPKIWYKKSISDNYPDGFIPKEWIIL